VAVEDLLDTGEYETVYNLRVADFHTYFVGCQEWGFSVWAHNSYEQFKEALIEEGHVSARSRRLREEGGKRGDLYGLYHDTVENFAGTSEASFKAALKQKFPSISETALNNAWESVKQAPPVGVPIPREDLPKYRLPVGYDPDVHGPLRALPEDLLPVRDRLYIKRPGDEVDQRLAREAIARGDVDANGQPIFRCSITGEIMDFSKPWVYEHSPMVRDHWNTVGWNMTHEQRTAWYKSAIIGYSYLEPSQAQGGAAHSTPFVTVVGPNFTGPVPRRG
jgi:hypothetical protein